MRKTLTCVPARFSKSNCERCISHEIPHAPKTSLIAIADLTYERYLSAAGIRTERYGPPMTIPHAPGKAPLTVVAGEIPLDQQKGARFHRLVSALNNVEIADETLVLGSASISA